MQWLMLGYQHTVEHLQSMKQYLVLLTSEFILLFLKEIQGYYSLEKEHYTKRKNCQCLLENTSIYRLTGSWTAKVI